MLPVPERFMIKFKIVFLLLIFSFGIQAQSRDDAEIAKLNAEMAAHYRKGELDDALPIADKVVELTTARFGRGDLNTAKALKNRGFIENAKGDAKKAAATLDDAADIFKNQRDLSKPDAAIFAEMLEVLAGLKLRDKSPSAENTL